ncbi:LOW QUALITY PROTEIN: hypothetical protein CVT25_010242 [Psilocybe cyanescens]|uniref:GH16 domain-containing protein n=1 Tax=Psilocybe cyanescens TaxID=93625 RepID=A0A409XD41_PSICY|nr:LOW QUALITY PROTEIN: hypothetical protein CVT25_010242 [Psilocybe cyanescens]
MCTLLSFGLLLLGSSVSSTQALSDSWKTPLRSISDRIWPSHSISLGKRDSLNWNPDGTPFLWLPQDEYSGKTFYDRWKFFDMDDPTNCLKIDLSRIFLSRCMTRLILYLSCSYINRTAAFESGLVSIQDDGTVIMRADHETHLERGIFRKSVRIESLTTYNSGLFILDLNSAPWGCAVWPAFWTVGLDNWPYDGEIDVIEGVHDNEHNQVAWHTGPGCSLDPKAKFTGTISSSNGKSHTDCNALINHNSGCGVTEWSRASYGPYFDLQGGGAFAMKWDENDISVWSFYRAAIPTDITDGVPDPSKWGLPSARLDASQCDIEKYFVKHSIVFGQPSFFDLLFLTSDDCSPTYTSDITFCGDWAGNSYATSGCPGTCEDRLMDPVNFENASWSINSLKVYKKTVLTGSDIVQGNASSCTSCNLFTSQVLASLFIVFLATLFGL